MSESTESQWRQEQRHAIRFCILLGKSGIKTWRLLQNTHKDKLVLSRRTVYNWYARLKEGWQSAELLLHVGCPSTSSTDKKLIPQPPYSLDTACVIFGSFLQPNGLKFMKNSTCLPGFLQNINTEQLCWGLQVLGRGWDWCIATGGRYFKKE